MSSQIKFVNIHGATINQADLAWKHAKPKPQKAEKEKTFSRGIFVRGVEPGAFESAAKGREAEIAAAIENNADTEKKHRPVPVVLTLADYLRTAKKKKVAKRFQIRESAEQMAEMMRKAGWLVVEVFDDTGARK